MARMRGTDGWRDAHETLLRGEGGEGTLLRESLPLVLGDGLPL
jgi:hypothetical protein